MEEITLSVVIVNYNVKYFLEQCLYSLRAALQGMEAEVFVVDNNSTDGSVAYLKPNFPEVTFIENSDNPGFAKANNQAIRLAKGKYILLLNPDTVIGEDSIRSLCYFLDEKPKAGALGVKMIDGNGVFLPESKRSFPTPWVSFCKMFGLSRLFPKNPRFAKYSLPYLNPDARHKVDVLAGAFMLIRKEALDKAGLLDEDFFMYGEDIDLSYRLKLAGYKNYYMPERILHYKGESTSKGNIKYVKIFYGAMLIFYRKHYSGAGKLFSLLIRLAVWFRALLDLMFHASANKKTKSSRRRLLILSSEMSLETVRTACLKQIPNLEFVNHWNLDEHRVMDCINRSNRMKGFTDIAFCYNDVRFEQLLLLMDKMPDKHITYHIYNKKSGVLVSPGKK